MVIHKSSLDHALQAIEIQLLKNHKVFRHGVKVPKFSLGCMREDQGAEFFIVQVPQPVTPNARTRSDGRDSMQRKPHRGSAFARPETSFFIEMPFRPCRLSNHWRTILLYQVLQMKSIHPKSKYCIGHLFHLLCVRQYLEPSTSYLVPRT